MINEGELMKQRVKAADVRAVAGAIGAEVRRVGSISTDLRTGLHKGKNLQPQRLAILHACESGKLHNRSYIIDARAHAEDVLVKREGINEAAAVRTWGLMRDLWEMLPHSRLCVSPDDMEGSVLLANGAVRSSAGTTSANPYIAGRIQQLHALLPEASKVLFNQIRNDRLRVYVEIHDAEGGLMLCTDGQAINDMTRRVALELSDEESLHLQHRRDAWVASLGITQGNLLPVLDLLGSLIRMGPVDACELVVEEGR